MAWGGIILISAVVLLCQVLPARGQGPTPSTSRPVILEFARKFCPICKKMEQVLKEVQAQYTGQFEVRLVYMDEEEYLFRRYKISIVPTQVFLDAAGKEVFRHENLMSKEKLVQKLRQLKFIPGP